MRGTHDVVPRPQATRRFIPACAGNSSSSLTAPRPPSVHPRVCGELQSRRQRSGHRRRFIPACAGNSGAARLQHVDAPVHPRVCGELALATLAPTEDVRFIPAYAGNSLGRSGQSRSSPVHPRVCGELLFHWKASTPRAGSSPRVRGTQCVDAPAGGVMRFIPACAGNSASYQSGR